jgi:hypothetical protein
MRKTLMKIGKEGMNLNIKKAMYDKPMANIICNQKKMKPFPLKTRMSQGYTLSSLLFKTFFEFLS